MHRPHSRWTRWSFDQIRPNGIHPFTNRTEFYREEFLKRRRSLEQQREAYSDGELRAFDDALSRILAELDRMSARDDADRVVSDLLRHFDLVTGLSAWRDPSKLH
ncbi:MAG: hypothetical protein KJ061_04680 [Vicinamibacteraceae bacterium]|nr:hypothetical protein [Vicinamibacteraceae bacterium]